MALTAIPCPEFRNEYRPQLRPLCQVTLRRLTGRLCRNEQSSGVYARSAQTNAVLRLLEGSNLRFSSPRKSVLLYHHIPTTQGRIHKRTFRRDLDCRNVQRQHKASKPVTESRAWNFKLEAFKAAIGLHLGSRLLPNLYESSEKSFRFDMTVLSK